MCLSVPIKITEIRDNNMALGILNDVSIEFSIELIRNPQIGKYAIVHAGVAIEMLNEDDAQKTIQMINDLVNNGSNQ